MNPAPVFLAAALGSDLPKTNRGFGPQSSLLFSDVLLIIGLGLGVLVVLAALVYGWTKLKLKRKGRRHVSSGQKVFRGSHGSSDEHEPSDLDLDNDEVEESEEESESQGSQADKRKYKYRVRRRSHRSRNPTLSQTGGLPPVKAPEPTKPG